MVDCYRCAKKDLRKAFIFEDESKKVVYGNCISMPTRYLCIDCAQKETELVRDDILKHWDEVDETDIFLG